MDIFTRNDLSPRMALLLLVVLAALGFLLFMALGLLAGAIITGTWDLSLLVNSDMFSPKGLMAIRIMQIFQTTGIFIFPSLILAYIASKQPYILLGFKNFSSRGLWLSLLFMLCALPGINLVASLNAEIPMPTWMIDMESAAERLIKALLVTDSFSVLSINLVMVAVLPAIGEELFFRGIVQRYICKMTRSTFVGVLITSIIFSAIHLQFQGFIPRMLLGMIFGYLYVWSRSIWVPILVHFFNNAMATFAYFLIGRGVISMDIENMGSMSDMWQLGLASIALSVLLIWLIRRESAIAE